jgi:hypothetical protein
MIGWPQSCGLSTMEIDMERNDESDIEGLIVLGAITSETKGVANEPLIDFMGNFSGGGLSDD